MPPEEAGYTYAVEPTAIDRLLANEEESIYGPSDCINQQPLSALYRYSYPFSTILVKLSGICQRERDMHPLTTNICAQTYDVYRFGFESAGVLEIDNEYSGLAVAPTHLY